MSKHKPLVFLDVSIDGDPLEKMIFEVTQGFKLINLFFLLIESSFYQYFIL